MAVTCRSFTTLIHIISIATEQIVPQGSKATTSTPAVDISHLRCGGTAVTVDTFPALPATMDLFYAGAVCSLI